MKTLSTFDIPQLKLYKEGKVRYCYEIGSNLLIVATDRVSAFDYILPTPIPDKGRTLTQLSKFWFQKTSSVVKNHLISTDWRDFPPEIEKNQADLDGRSMLVERTELIEIECVVRGYLAGSGWMEYQKSSTVCGQKLPKGLRESDCLDEPIFTPATKARSGHDENISIDKMCSIIGKENAKILIEKSLNLYTLARDFAFEKGLILADTKFEFGIKDGQIILIDELLTPDSSRYWSVSDYEPGKSQNGFDKQFVRDYLLSIQWNKMPPVPLLPDDIVEGTRTRYLALYSMLTGQDLFNTSTSISSAS
ncbi:MAG: phosphoribosylaminoimidazolesuccinocarboxamide synthase [Chlamydiota bacterium]|nr:phosphoribosylaminoimidazolesuccinocarboxamide synthase [Chlamydiota bacterium]